MRVISIRQLTVLLTVSLAIFFASDQCHAQTALTTEGIGGNPGIVWDLDTLRIHENMNATWGVDTGLSDVGEVDVEISDPGLGMGWLVYSMDSADGEQSVLVEVTVDVDGIVDWAMVPINLERAAQWLNNTSDNDLGMMSPQKLGGFQYCCINSSFNSSSHWGQFWDDYWHFLTNPSELDDDLEPVFYVAGGVGVGAGVIAGGIVAAPVVAATTITIPTISVGTTTTVGVSGGGVLVAGTATTITTGTVTMSGTTVVAAGTAAGTIVGTHVFMTGGAGGGGGGIQFGGNANQVSHTFRHIDGVIDRTRAIAEITEDLSTAVINSGLNIRTVIIDGIEVTYNAFRLPSGLVNVGRITIP